jgi:D-hydroxyproline dehydrogenase subunit alpha
MTDIKKSFDVLVIGGGPAGIAAACCAAENGLRTAVADDNESLGGQIWRNTADASAVADRGLWLERLARVGVSMLCGTRVIQQPRPGTLLAESEDGKFELHYSKLVLATGARERFLPFPGWTLLNVMGVGALQALVKSGLPVSGKRVVVAGTGPLLAAVAAYLRKHGAEIPVICEQATWSRLVRFAAGMILHPPRLAQTLRLRRELATVPFAANSWVIQALGQTAVNSVQVLRNGNIENIDCDYLACSFHLVPNLELPLLLGCEVRNGYVHVDELQRTSVSAIFCVGEPTGIAGLEMALIQGQIAGLVASGRVAHAERLFPKRRRLLAFAQALDYAFRLRHELRALPSDNTIICRCEDVTYGRLHQQKSWRAAKLQSRCGMGACQSRVCGPATEFLFDWKADSVRPPIFPARISSLMPLNASGDEPAALTGGQP